MPTAPSFWTTLATPIIGLSPMDGVSDHPFRYIQKKYGRPAVLYTEFTSVEGVCHGAKQLLKDFSYDETQRPIIGQIYGTTPEYFRQTAIVLCQLGFDGIDINMGCPAKNVAHSGAGAALIKTPALAQEIIKATKHGVEQWQNGATAADCPDIVASIVTEVETRQSQLPEIYQQVRQIPVSVKTRVGFDQPVIAEWIPTLLEMEPAAIALHGRTLKQQYGGLANWELIGQAKELARSTNTKLLGNGDIHSITEAQEKISTYGLDGVLIGRATMGNPYLYYSESELPTAPSIFEIALEHSELFEKIYADEEKYSFLPMRKHLGWYVKNIPDASQIRIELFKASTSQEVKIILQAHSLIG
ncbi:MAG: tRNA-dihydrouridine synthase [bacterium]|nr:tRNA-dihydrouridine synthase [bacterium]